MSRKSKAKRAKASGAPDPRPADHAGAEEAPPPEEADEQTPESTAEVGAPAPAETDQLKDRLLRLQADFDNFRKRTLREREQLRATAGRDLIEELLPVLDHFELGLANAIRHEANAQVVAGFRLVYDQLGAVLQRAGLKPIEAEGALFDPHLHEAITHLPSEEHPADVVMTETRRGYLLGDQLLRASQVVVSSGPAVASAGDDEGDEA